MRTKGRPLAQIVQFFLTLFKKNAQLVLDGFPYIIYPEQVLEEGKICH